MTIIENVGIAPGYTISGLLVGLAVGMTGVGGGSLMTPLLVLVFGFHPSTAVGTDLLFAAATKTVGTTIHSAGKTVDWVIVRRLAIGSVPATLLCLLGIGYFGINSQGVTTAITAVLGVALLLSASSLLFKERIVHAISRRYPNFGEDRSVRLTIAIGFVLGILVSLSSVGAGALGTVALIVLYPRLPIVRIVGSDIAHAVPLTLLAGLGHWYLGTINFALLVSLLAGSVPGIILGSLAARYAPDKALKLILGGILFLVGLKMLVK
ncbi:sulfite exporter TauE/SafE family protein [Acidocella sp. KAb 2-4]|uniref:sulfite exporter TauE/SafE family protein n=1 Tax=Acidocella sp. KAb 2-4 TaxID=2885158 RepID=UPI001D05D7D7|nr:sulfite exporter TauE/SafE family protein [Acidocella sp. KAb 2-4]MCB5943683.1 sulfite exporter TauE/SafE family protein [Acidocella sp. KAb 2-4]